MGSIMNKYAPTPTDYHDEDNWLAYLDRGCGVDTFYLYPTMGHDNPRDAFCSASDKTMRGIALDVTPTQMLPFMWDTNVYAPFYRQAGFSSMKPLLESDESNRLEAIQQVEDFMREEAMDDIYAALDFFFENCNNGKPFFLVSHSQGSILMKIALEDYRAKHPERFERMIAAYCPGWSFTQEWCDKVGLPFSQGPTDTGVIASWNAERPGLPDEFNPCSVPEALCLNPVTWESSTSPTPFSKSLGTLVLNAAAGEAFDREMLLAFSENLGLAETEEGLDEEQLNSIARSDEFINASREWIGAIWEEVLWADQTILNMIWEYACQGADAGEADGASDGESDGKAVGRADAGKAATNPAALPFSIKHGFVSAWVNPERGTLTVEYPDQHSLTPKALGRNSLHMLEFPLFFEGIHKNLCDRIEAWWAQA